MTSPEPLYCTLVRDLLHLTADWPASFHVNGRLLIVSEVLNAAMAFGNYDLVWAEDD